MQRLRRNTAKRFPLPVETNQATGGVRLAQAIGCGLIKHRLIDTEQHGLTDWGIKVNLRDGVTTQMDFEVGALNISEWYATRSKFPSACRTTLRWHCTVAKGEPVPPIGSTPPPKPKQSVVPPAAPLPATALEPAVEPDLDNLENIKQTKPTLESKHSYTQTGS